MNELQRAINAAANFDRDLAEGRLSQSQMSIQKVLDMQRDLADIEGHYELTQAAHLALEALLRALQS